MFNVAVPDIAREFKLSPSGVSWVITGYIAVFALGSVTYGKLADFSGVRRLVITGLFLLNAGSVLGFISSGYGMLVAARLTQAAGGSAIPALAMVVATRYFPHERRGFVFGAISAAVALGAGIGPVLSGLLTDLAGWRTLFPVTFLTLPAIIILFRLLPPERSGRGHFDTVGLLILSALVTSVLILVLSPSSRWLAITAVLAAWFVIHIRRVEAPFVEPAVFSIKAFPLTLITAFLVMGSVFGMMFAVPLMLRALHGISVRQIGWAMFPAALAGSVTGIAAGRMVDRLGGVRITTIGMALLMAGYTALSIIAGKGILPVTLILVVCYAGFTCAQSALPHTLAGTLPKGQTGIGMGIYNLFLFLSGAFSSAMVGRLLDGPVGRLEPGSVVSALNMVPAAGRYRSLFLLLAITVLLAGGLFHFGFRPGARS